MSSSESPYGFSGDDGGAGCGGGAAVREGGADAGGDDNGSVIGSCQFFWYGASPGVKTLEVAQAIIALRVMAKC